ncbi:CDP-alcohol phosphatidyltransferase family protein [Candidatus Peregrinibacteria bacterium]|nr:CDP-alcohol phosphatidyltransferase family protein [Candidatus Peregrinibacteria bacterium]
MPNLITFGRLVLATVSFALMFFGQWAIAFFSLLIAVLMDVADGKLARHLNQVTKQGIFLDVMVDKIVIISAFFIIGLEINIIFFYLALLMLIREYSMDTMRSIIASKNTAVSADKFSKIKGVIFMISMVGMIYNKAFNNDIIIWQDFFEILSSAGMIFAYITLIRFFIKYKKQLLS